MMDHYLFVAWSDVAIVALLAVIVVELGLIARWARPLAPHKGDAFAPYAETARVVTLPESPGGMEITSEEAQVLTPLREAAMRECLEEQLAFERSLPFTAGYRPDQRIRAVRSRFSAKCVAAGVPEPDDVEVLVSRIVSE